MRAAASPKFSASSPKKVLRVRRASHSISPTTSPSSARLRAAESSRSLPAR